MKGMVPIDLQTSVSAEHFAIVYLPKRSRNRFPAGCVEIVDSKEVAIKAALQLEKKYAAIVIGPSKSSEGQFIYYLKKWLPDC